MKTRPWLLAPILLLLATPARADVSQLWGHEGELWNPNGRLPDYSYAGYRAGRRPIPEVEEVVNVRDFGARPNDRGDDSRAIQRAIDRAAAMGGGAVFLPRGRYRIRNQLEIRRNGVVLRGAGRNETTLYVTRSLGQIHGWDIRYANGNSGIISVGRGRGYRRVATVERNADRGDRWLTLSRDARSRGIRGGRYIRIMMRPDRGDRSLWNHRHNDQNGSPGGDCDDAYGELGYWVVRVRSVDGNRIELDQPLRHEIRRRWNPVVYLARPVREVGVEYLTIEMERRAYRGHHNERGYNAIGFGDGPVADSWIRNVRIAYADNAIDLRRSKHVTVQNVVISGNRPGGGGIDGHHGITVGIDSLVEDLTINANFIHEVTFAERTTGSVVSNGRGSVRWSLDHHARAMLENLVTNLHADYDWQSGGGACSPAAGARHTYWNFDRPLRSPSWGFVQTNMVGRLSSGTSRRRTNQRAWFEPVRGLAPHNLYRAQLRRRRWVERRGRFAATNAGVRRAFAERTPERWAIVRAGGDRRYWLASRSYGPRSGGRLGERSLLRGTTLGDGAILARANPYRGLASHPGANYALILGYQDERNYYFARFDARRGKSGIFLVKDGERSALVRVPGRLLRDSRWHDVGFARSGSTLTMVFDGEAVATASDATLGAGRVGVGSLDDSVYFDDLHAQSFEELPPGAGGGGEGEVLTDTEIDVAEEDDEVWVTPWDPADEEIPEDGGEWEPEGPLDDFEEGEESLDELLAANVGVDDDEGVDDPGADPGLETAAITGGHLSCAAAAGRAPRGIGLGGLLAASALWLWRRRRSRRPGEARQ